MTSNKSKILAAASELLVEKGMGGLSVRSIAASVGVSTIGIYSHFNGKQGIVEALYIQGYERLYAAMFLASTIDDPKAAALQGCRDYMAMADAHEAEYRLIFGETNMEYEPGEDAVVARMTAYERLVELAARLLPEEAPLEAKQRAAMRIWAVVHGYVSIKHHAVIDTVSNESWSKQTLSTVECIIDGLQKNGV